MSKVKVKNTMCEGIQPFHTFGTRFTEDPFLKIFGEESSDEIVWVNDPQGTLATAYIENPFDLPLSLRERSVSREVMIVSKFIKNLKYKSKPESPEIRSKVATNIYELIKND